MQNIIPRLAGKSKHALETDVYQSSPRGWCGWSPVAFYFYVLAFYSINIVTLVIA